MAKELTRYCYMAIKKWRICRNKPIFVIPQKLASQLARALGHEQALVGEMELVIDEIGLGDDVDDPVAQRPLGDHDVVPRDPHLCKIRGWAEVAKERLRERETAGGDVVVSKLVEDAERVA